MQNQAYAALAAAEMPECESLQNHIAKVATNHPLTLSLSC
jgi:hypothetical protein